MATEDKNYLEMSDEDFLEETPDFDDDVALPAADGDFYADEDAGTDTSAVDDDGSDGDDTDTTDDDGVDDESDDGSSEEDEAEDDGIDEGAAESTASASAEDEESTDGESDSTSEDSDSDDLDKASKSDNSAIDYKSFYEEITKPFKANGKDFSVKSVEDAKQLMSMGAGFSKKMAVLKPGLKSVRLLEKNDLLDEGKLNFLIDLNNKDPKAIAKLLQDANIDPDDIDVEDGKDYVATSRVVDDKEMELNNVLDDLQDSAHYSDLLTVVSKTWDATSKQAVGDNPEVLNVIHGHMESGVYGVIAGSMERERTLGRLAGLSDLEAYRQVGDALHAKGGFDHLFKPEGTQDDAGHQTNQQNVSHSTDKQKDETLKDKKRAAAGNKKKPTQKSKSVPNYLSMSDEDFEKQFDSNLM
jgi:hypothetical protein